MLEKLHLVPLTLYDEIGILRLSVELIDYFVCGIEKIDLVRDFCVPT